MTARIQRAAVAGCPLHAKIRDGVVKGYADDRESIAGRRGTYLPPGSDAGLPPPDDVTL
jgi:hypothetical protein